MKEVNVVLDWANPNGFEKLADSKFIFTDRKEVRR